MPISRGGAVVELLGQYESGISMQRNGCWWMVRVNGGGACPGTGSLPAAQPQTLHTLCAGGDGLTEDTG